MINPVEAAATFATVTEGRDAEAKAAIALRATLVATIILIGFGFIGDALLGALGISFPAFRIAGGLLLLRVGFNMVFSEKSEDKTAAAQRVPADPSVFPLAIPIITGPGALTAIVTLMTKSHQTPFGETALVAIAVVVMAITFLSMRASMRLTAILGETGVDAIGRIMGIIVAAISIQLVVDGVGELLPFFLTQAK